MTADTLDSPALAAQKVEAEPRAVAVPSMAEVYDAHFDYVWRCLRSLGVRDAVLDDALQDVFLVVHDKLAAFDGRARLQTWLYAIVIRIARRYRTRDGRAALPLAAEPVDQQPPAHEALELAERGELARSALDALDEDKREVFVLAVIEELSAPQIAEITGEPVNTIYSRLRAARSAFFQQVARLQLRGARRPL